MKLIFKILAYLIAVMLITFAGFYFYLKTGFVNQAYEIEKKDLHDSVNSITRMIDYSLDDYYRDSPHLSLLLADAKNKDKAISDFLANSDLEIAFYLPKTLGPGKIFIRHDHENISVHEVDFSQIFTQNTVVNDELEKGPFVFKEGEYLVGSTPYAQGRIFVGATFQKNYTSYFIGNQYKMTWDNIPRILDQEWPRDWVVTEKKTSATIIGRTFFNDLSGKKSVVLLIEMRRSHLADVNSFLEKFTISYIILGTLIVAIIFFLVHSLILKRVLKIKSQLQEIKKHVDFSKRLEVKGNDELSETTAMVNTTLDRLNGSYQFAERLSQLSTSAVFTVDKGKIITSWNKRAEEITGYEAQDMIGKPCSYFSLIPCRDRCGLYDPNVPKPCYGRECVIVTKDGRKIQILKNADFLRDQKGEIIGGIENFEDITLKVKAQKERELLQQQVFQTSKLASLGTLGAGIAHELNNPLAIVMGFTDLLKGKLEEIKQQELIDIVTKIEQNADRMRKIVSHIKEFSRDVSRDEMTSENINEIANSILFFIGRQMANRNIKMELSLANNLPLIKMNKVKMQSVVQNLVLNARDELSDLEKWPKKVITVTTALSPDGKHIILEVTDTGRGIPSDILDKIFEPFFTTKPTGKGTGLGLSLVYGIVQEHHGTITVKNNNFGGACFTVSLPINPPNTAKTPT